MPYPITFYGLEGQTGLYACIKRKEDGKVYDESNDAWIDPYSVPLPNGDFADWTATDPNNWTVLETGTSSVEESGAGTGNCRLVGATGVAAITSQNTPIVAGLKYRMTVVVDEVVLLGSGLQVDTPDGSLAGIFDAGTYPREWTAVTGGQIGLWSSQNMNIVIASVTLTQVDNPFAGVCRLSLTEDGTEAGKYTITDASFNPRLGGKYVTYVFDSADDLVFFTENTYSATQPKNALQIVQAIQQEQRLPQSVDLTRVHDKLMLAFVNKVLRTLGKTPERWDALKISGGFVTIIGQTVYTIDPINAVSMDSITHVQIGTNEPIDPLVTEEAFREYKRTNKTPSRPLARRLYGRVGRAIMIELVPPPDVVYQVDFEGYQKILPLVNTTDVPLLNSDTIINGGVMLAKDEAGRKALIEAEIFANDVGADTGNEGEENIGDLDPI